MQEIDILLKEYMSDEKRFSDLLNGYMFGGKQVVMEADIHETDSQTLEILGKFGFRKTGQKIRDTVRKVVFGMNFCVVGVENQTQIHYAMPIRVLEMDAGGYGKQLRKLRLFHRRENDLKGAQFLSGFSKHDKVKPVFSLIIYYGAESWDGAKDLSELLDTSEIPKEMLAWVNNYKLNILDF